MIPFARQPHPSDAGHWPNTDCGQPLLPRPARITLQPGSWLLRWVNLIVSPPRAVTKNTRNLSSYQASPNPDSPTMVKHSLQSNYRILLGHMRGEY